ncbi:MAG: addiction module protein [Cyclobacteriaceae bacterium]|nr:addiction module protein [Cyclobacteriaceae bacterium]
MELSIKDILKLDIKERLSIAEAIWDSVALETDISLTTAQKEEINRRLELFERGETKLYTLQEIKNELTM